MRRRFQHTVFLFIALIGGFVSCEEIPKESISENSWSFDLNMPPDSNWGGDTFAFSVQTDELIDRENAILSEIKQGNVPNFLRNPIPVQSSKTIMDSLYECTFYVMPDYLSIGTDSDHFLMPMTPILAQKIMDQINGVLPTRKMVDLIWKASTVKLGPLPIAPSTAMTTIPVFDQHNNMVEYYRNNLLEEHPLGELVSGHKKDVILSNRIAENPKKVVIYGWHYPDGTAIQPLYSGHVNWYADYSHGIRPVLSICQVNDTTMAISDILRDPILYQLLSDEIGPMTVMRYDTFTSNYP